MGRHCVPCLHLCCVPWTGQYTDYESYKAARVAKIIKQKTQYIDHIMEWTTSQMCAFIMERTEEGEAVPTFRAFRNTLERPEANKVPGPDKINNIEFLMAVGQELKTRLCKLVIKA